MSISLRTVKEIEIHIIAEMNAQLIEDERSTNPMNREQLELRALDWLRADWNIDFICANNKIVGYALYQFKYQSTQFNRNLKEVYLRQYFIRREERNKGYGIDGIKLLKEQRFNGIKTIIIDVLEANPKGRAFWEKAGFMPYYTNMRMEQEVRLP